MFRQQRTLKTTRIKLWNTVALPASLYGSEKWNVETVRRKKNNSSRSEIIEKNSRIHLDRLYKKNTEITKGPNITPSLNKVQEYRRNWLQHINRMPCNRLPRIMKYDRPKGGRNQGRQLKRLLDV